MKEHKKKGISGHMSGMGMHKHATSGRSPHNKRNSIELSMSTNKKIKEETERQERIRKQGLVDNVRDLFK